MKMLFALWERDSVFWTHFWYQFILCHRVLTAVSQYPVSLHWINPNHK